MRPHREEAAVRANTMLCKLIKIISSLLVRPHGEAAAALRFNAMFRKFISPSLGAAPWRGGGGIEI